MSRIFTVSFASVYPHYVTKVERKGRTKAELDQVIEWLTGFGESALNGHLTAGTTVEDFFTDARLNPQASLITGSVCGGARRRRRRSADAEDPLSGQAGRRACEGQGDGQDPEGLAGGSRRHHGIRYLDEVDRRDEHLRDHRSQWVVDGVHRQRLRATALAGRIGFTGPCADA